MRKRKHTMIQTLEASRDGVKMPTKELTRLLCDKIWKQAWDEAEALLDELPEGSILPNCYFRGCGDTAFEVPYNEPVVGIPGQWRDDTILHMAARVRAPAAVIQKLLSVIDHRFCFHGHYKEMPLSLMVEHATELEAIRLVALANAPYISWIDRQGNTPLDDLMQSTLDDHEGEIRLEAHDVADLMASILEAYPDATLAVNKVGANLLHRAIMKSDGDDEFAMLRVLLDARAEMLLQKDSNGHTPLQLAYNRAFGEAEKRLLDFLLERIGPELLTFQGNDGQTLLHEACASNVRVDVLEALVSKAPIALLITDVHGQTPIHIAAKQDDERAAKRMQFLLEQSASVALLSRDAEGKTPLHHACGSVSEEYENWCFCSTRNEVIAKLVTECPSALQVTDEQGVTPLVALCQCYSEGTTVADCASHEAFVETLMTLVSGVPLKMCDSPSLHDLLRSENCTPAMANLFVDALKNQVSNPDEIGDFPLHIVAAKHSPEPGWDSLLQTLVPLYPEACLVPNYEGILPLEMMARSGSSWSNGMQWVFAAHPAAVVDLSLDACSLSVLLAKVTSAEKRNVLFQVLTGVPSLLRSK